MAPKSAKMKEKQRLYAEERKRLLDEELKAKAEKEFLENQIILQKEKEALEQIEKGEYKQRANELDEVRAVLTEITNSYKRKMKDRREEERWSRYMLCDGSPDPRILPQINSYINLWKEDEERIDIEDVFQDSKLCLRLIDEICYILDDIANEPDPEMDPHHLEMTKTKLIDLMQMKLNRASHEILLRASELANSETANLEVTYTNSHFSLCIWGNLTKNPRIRSFNFTEENISFEISKILQQSDCAIRVLFLSFDPFSHLCGSYHATRIPVEETSIETEIEPEVKPETKVPVLEKKVSDVNRTSMVNFDLLNLNDFESKQPAAPEVELIVEEDIPPPPEDLIQIPPTVKYEMYQGQEYSLNLREYSMIGGVFLLEIFMLPEQPKIVGKWAMSRKIIPAELIPFPYAVNMHELGRAHTLSNSLKSKMSEVDTSGTRRMDSKGSTQQSIIQTDGVNISGPILVQVVLMSEVQILVDIPELAWWDHELKEWTLDGIQLEMYSPQTRVVRFRTSKFGVFAFFQNAHMNFPFQRWELRPYENSNIPTEVVGLMMGSPERTLNSSLHPPEEDRLSMTPQDLSGMTTHTSPKSAEDQSTYMINTVTPHVDVMKEILEEKETGIEKVGYSQLSTDLLDEGSMDPENISQSQTSMMQTHLKQQNHCLLTIVAAIHEVKLEILGSRVALLPDEEKTELNFLAGRWFTVSQLVRELRFYGVNIFPREDTQMYVELEEGENECSQYTMNPILEKMMYEQMALLSPSVAFSSSRWNNDHKTTDKYLLLSTEHLYPAPVDEENWKLYQVTRKKVIKLKGNEFDRHFNDQPCDSVGFHAELYHMYMSEACEVGKNRVQNIDDDFFHTVKQLLIATGILSYC